jgi:NAD(P)-dependent dehydrogenase (short-subunit alcohol dehydrogenase family)
MANTAQQTFTSGTAVITGSGSGIGEAMAKQLAGYGMNVVIAEISEENGTKVAAEINASGGKALFVQTDVSNADSVKAMADKAYDTFGDVNVLVNNAGIGVMGKIWEISTDDWNRGVGINVMGIIYGIQSFVPRMLQSKSECYIANVASLASLTISPNNAPYISSKHMALSLTETLYVEMQNEANPVNVSIILPGVVKTSIMDNMTISNDSYADTLAMMTNVIVDKGMSAEEASDIFLNGMAQKDFWITSHPGVIDAAGAVRGEYIANQTLPVPVGDEIFRN